MPIELTRTDVPVLNALLKDGRKSFRQISRETKLSTPTVKTRFNRLINMGVIKSIIPIVDFDLISYKVKDESHNIEYVDRNIIRQSINDRKNTLVFDVLRK